MLNSLAVSQGCTDVYLATVLDRKMVHIVFKNDPEIVLYCLR